MRSICKEGRHPWLLHYFDDMGKKCLQGSDRTGPPEKQESNESHVQSLYRPNFTSKIPSDSNDIMLDCRWPNEEGFEIGQMLLQISA